MELISPSDYAKQAVLAVQNYSMLAGRSVANIFRHPRYVADTVQQLDLVGVGSLHIVILTALFTGAVFAVYASRALQQVGRVPLTGELVYVSKVRELGHVVTGLTGV